MRTTRRAFLKTALAAGAFTIVPRRVLGGPGYTAPSDELTKAVIGTGGMGHWHLGNTGARLLAVCDVDEDHLNSALTVGGAGVKGYKDFREVQERRDIDIVHIATPPHWHGLIAVDKLGRTPIIIGQKAGSFAVSMESCAFPNLGFEAVRDLGPGEIVRLTGEGAER